MKQDKKKQNEILNALIQLTNRNLGFTPKTPNEFNKALSLILKKTGDNLSPSTMKRLWGYINYDGSFSETTLNILARYNHFSDWETFLHNYGKHIPLNSNTDSGFLPETIIDPGQYQLGKKVELVWHDGKGCELECIGKLRFKVVKATNIKLKAGDLVTLHTLCIGHPVYVSDIDRGDIHFKSYVGAQKGGLLHIREIS